MGTLGYSPRVRTGTGMKNIDSDGTSIHDSGSASHANLTEAQLLAYEIQFRLRETDTKRTNTEQALDASNDG